MLITGKGRLFVDDELQATGPASKAARAAKQAPTHRDDHWGRGDRTAGLWIGFVWFVSLLTIIRGGF